MFIPFDFVISLLGIKSKKVTIFFKCMTFIDIIKYGIALFDLYDGLLCIHH